MSTFLLRMRPHISSSLIFFVSAALFLKVFGLLYYFALRVYILLSFSSFRVFYVCVLRVPTSLFCTLVRFVALHVARCGAVWYVHGGDILFLELRTHAKQAYSWNEKQRQMWRMSQIQGRIHGNPFFSLQQMTAVYFQVVLSPKSGCRSNGGSGKYEEKKIGRRRQGR